MGRIGNVCVNCSGHRGPGDGGRGLCSTCYTRHRRAGTIGQFPILKLTPAERVTEVATMMVGRRTPPEIAKALETTATALYRAMYRANRPDLARMFSRDADIEQRKSALARRNQGR